MTFVAWFVALLVFSQNLSAQQGRFKVFKEDSESRAEIKNSKPLSVFYEKISWNQNPSQIETGYLYLSDRNTGEIVELSLTETEPNSGIFNLDFPAGALKQQSLAAEVYSAPQSMLTGKDRVGMIKTLIKDNSIKRKPFLLRVLREKGQIVDIFDEKDSAIAAYNKYREQMGLSPEDMESESIIEVVNKEKPMKKKVIDTSTLQSLFMANENDLTASNEKNRELREVMKSIEEKRRAKLLADYKSLSNKEKVINNKKATDLVQEASKQIHTLDLTNSMDNFLKASDLLPEQEDLYEQYGVSLYRTKKYNQAIVVLDISQPSDLRKSEKNFYLGLSFYDLKNYDEAIIYFSKVMATEDKHLGPTAAFYKGAALIELNQFDEAKVAFQYVLDHSNNPEMDKRAEQYLEYALDRKVLQDKRSNWFFIDGVMGLIYDSNIVLATDQAREQGTITNEEGWRLLGQLSPRIRPYYSDSDEINIDLDITTLKSFDNSFGSNSVAETADPILLEVGVPWTHRGILSGKGYFFDLIPSYARIIMDLDGTGNATITKSTKLAMNNTLVINKNWIAKGDYNFAMNDSNILGDTSSADSVGGGIKLTSIFILNKDLERYIIPEFGYQLNDAKGSTYSFSRVDLGLTYTTAIPWNFMWNNRLGYYLANYESTRTDNNYTLSSGVSRRINAHWNWGLMGSYIINDSTVNSYNKYNVVTTFSFSY